MLTNGMTAAVVPPSTILVVDDSATNLQVLVRTLHGSGHRILVAQATARPRSRSRSAPRPTSCCSTS